MTFGSASSPAIASAGSPGRSCCSPKIITDTKKRVGMMVARRRARKASIRASRSIHLEALQPHHAVGHGAQPGELRVVRPQPVAVIDVDDRAVLQDLRGDLLEEPPALG